MISVDWSVTIGRGPDDVFRHVADVARYPEWQQATGITGVLLAFDGLPEVGARFRLERVTRGRAGTIDCVVTAFEPGRRFAFQGDDSGGFSIGFETRLEPDGPGTRLDWRFSMTTPGLLGLAGSMLKREIRATAEQDFGGLKRRLEQVA
jgi:hypothetical protein